MTTSLGAAAGDMVRAQPHGGESSSGLQVKVTAGEFPVRFVGQIEAPFLTARRGAHLSWQIDRAARSERALSARTEDPAQKDLRIVPLAARQLDLQEEVVVPHAPLDAPRQQPGDLEIRAASAARGVAIEPLQQ